MHDFDKAREERNAEDRRFKIAGEVFVMRAGVRPEVLAAYEDLNEDQPATSLLLAIDEIVLDMIETGDDGHDRYKAIRLRVDDAVSLEDMQSLVKWLVEAQTNRPTVPPSLSTDGQGHTSTTSTDDSSLPVEQAVLAT